MAPQRILVVGGGVAGAAAAVLLGRAGHRVTLVERDAAGRSSGNPVDVRAAPWRGSSGSRPGTSCGRPTPGCAGSSSSTWTGIPGHAPP